MAVESLSMATIFFQVGQAGNINNKFIKINKIQKSRGWGRQKIFCSKFGFLTKNPVYNFSPDPKIL